MILQLRSGRSGVPFPESGVEWQRARGGDMAVTSALRPGEVVLLQLQIFTAVRSCHKYFPAQHGHTGCVLIS